MALSKSSPTSSSKSPPKKKAGVTVTISHTPQNFSMAVVIEGEGVGYSEGGGVSNPVQINWALVNGNGLSSPSPLPPPGGGVQVVGGEDPGEMWLGYEVGVLPPVLQHFTPTSASPTSTSPSPPVTPPPTFPLPLSQDTLNSIPGGRDPRLQFFSSTTFDTPRYSSCKVLLHVGGGEPPLTVSGVALPGPLTVTLGGSGGVWVLGKQQAQEGKAASNSSSSSSGVGGKEWREERARLGHVRAVILTRRAEADQCRKTLLLGALGGGGEGEGEREKGTKLGQQSEPTPSPATTSTGPKKKGGWWGGGGKK